MSGSVVTKFADCEICGAQDWSTAYSGPIRDGIFQKFKSEAVVARCAGCGVERLAEEHCMSIAQYESWEYRKKLEQDQDVETHHKAHDHFQKFAIDALWPDSLRGKTVADIGCAAGTFLDHIRGLAGRVLGVEPASYFHDHLKSIGVEVFDYARNAGAVAGKVDVAFSLQVIEHTADPRTFLAEILPLLGPDGTLLISTPNRRDILTELLPEDFRSFFYRTVHRWYFDSDSLERCAQLAGFETEWVKPIHRYGLSNTMAWLRDRKPTGWQRLPGIEPVADKLWQALLEQSGRADTLFARLRPTRPGGAA